MGPTVDVTPFRHLYPFQGSWLDRGGVRLHYLDEGAGDPVVMVHGNPSWSFYYRGLVQALRGSCRCVVPDHVGCGLSDKPGDDRYRYTLDRRVEDLDALLERVGFARDVTMVVHDWGGAIGLAWAAAHPERVARLVILNTGAFRLPAAKPLPFTLRLCRDTLLGALMVRGLNAFARAACRWCTVRPMPADVRRGYLAPYGSWADRIATLRFVQDIPLGPGDPAWPALMRLEEGSAALARIPALVCWGLRDFVFDRHFLDEFRRRLPAAEVHAFEDGGHYVLEDKGPEVAALVRSFLARHPLGGGART